MIVLDASVVLAALLKEPGGDVLAGLQDEIAISAINLGEVAAKLTERGYSADALRTAILPFRLASRELTANQAVQAGLWRNQVRKFGLSMGDRCCLALGLELGAEV